MNIVFIGSCGHSGYALTTLRLNPAFRACGIASAVPGDLNPDFVKILQDEFHVRLYDQVETMLDACRPDVAVIATRYDQNGVVSRLCLQRGIHCFTEKCIAHSLTLLQELRTCAAATSTQIIGMHAMRYTPTCKAVYDAVHSGRIGAPLLLTAQKSYCFGQSRPEFYKHADTYGGTILWVAIHAIDMSHWIMGDWQEVVCAQESTTGNAGYGDCESHCTIEADFGRGRLGLISADFLQPAGVGHADDQLRIAGERGVARFRDGCATLAADGEPFQPLPLEPAADFFGDFCAMLAGQGACRVTMESSFRVTEIALQARALAARHRHAGDGD